MANDIIGALRVTLGFDTSGFEHGSERATQIAKRDSAVIKNEISGARRAIGDLATAFIGVEAVQAARRALDYAASIKSVATQTGVSRRELQEYRFVASQTDLTQQDMDGSLQKLTKTIGEAKAGTKEQATLFRDLGIAVEDANGRVYSAGEVLPKIADALSRIKDPATRARLEVKLFGEAGQKLDSLLSQGSRGIETMRQRARELGIVLGDDLTDGAADANDKLSEIKMTLNARFAEAIVSHADAIQAMATAIAALTAESLKFISEYPRLSAALAGAAVGYRIAGGPGAIVGAAVGTIGGDYVARSAADGNMDLAYRKRALEAARVEKASLEKSAKNESFFGSLFSIRRTSDPNTRGGTVETATAEFQRQQALYAQALAASKANERATASVVPDGALPTPTPGRTRTRKGPRDRSQQIADAYERDLHGLVSDTLSARASMATSAEERAELEHRMLNDDIRFKKAEIQSNADYSKVRKDKLLFELQEFENAERQRIDWEKEDAIREEQARVDQAALDRDRDMLSIRASLATTAKERRAVQLELLDNDLKAVRLAAEEVLARHDSTASERQIAQAKIDQLGALRRGETLKINRETMGPMESYLDSIPDTVDEINEAYENIAANGLRNFNDGLADSAANILKLKGFAGQLFNQIIADLIRLQVQQAMGGGGFLSGLFKFGGSLLGLGGASAGLDLSAQAATGNFVGPRFANGGEMTIGGRRGIDRNLLSLNGQPIANVSYGEKLSIGTENGSQRIADLVRMQVLQTLGDGDFLKGLFKFGGSHLSLGDARTGLDRSAQAATGNFVGPRFANGGEMTIGGRRGIDRNVLSLNGQPIANVSYGEKLSIANDNGGQRAGAAVIIHPSAYFDAVVDDRASKVAAPMAVASSTHARSAAGADISRRQRRRIPGR